MLLMQNSPTTVGHVRSFLTSFEPFRTILNYAVLFLIIAFIVGAM